MTQDESQAEKIARIDANVKSLLFTIPLVHHLDKESAINKREHKIAISILGILSLPVIAWICKTLGIVLL